MPRIARAATVALIVLCTLAADPAAAAERQVYDGERTTTERWPDLVQVQFDTVACTGVLVAPTWVLTAAHCGSGPATVFGPRNRLDDPTWTSPSQAHLHPRYDRGSGRFDVALHRLSTPRRIHGAATVRLADAGDAALWEIGERLRFAGWGATQTTEHPDELQEGEATIAPEGTCRAETSEVCLQGASSPCHGDSGGPIVHDDGGERVLVAVAIRASKGCRGHSVGLLVPSVRTWIDELVASGGGRVAGSDRYATSAALAEDWRHAETAVVVGGAAPSDALAAGPAAAAAGAPVLLTHRDRLSPQIRSTFERLRPKRIVVVGGTAVVSDAVVAELAAMAPVERVAGPDRYTTAAAVVGHRFRDRAPLVFVTDGRQHADAVVTGGVAALRGAPLLSVDGSRPLPAATLDLLRRLAPDAVVAVGDAGALSSQVIDDLQTVAPVDRFDEPALAERTARLLATHAPETTEVLVVAREAVADGLAAAPYATLLPRAPVLLAERTCLDRSLVEHLDRSGVRALTLVGGSAVLSDEVSRRRPCAG